MHLDYRCRDVDTKGIRPDPGDQLPRIRGFLVTGAHNVGHMEPSRADRQRTALTFFAIAALFALVGRWSIPANVDVIATDVPAWRVATEQTLEVELLEEANPWIVSDKEGRPVSNRAPGLIATPVPAYAIAQPSDFTNLPGTATALLMTLGALYILHRLLIRHFDHNFSLVSILVLALGTTTWTISAAQLWPHGPGQFWLALALMGAASSRYALTGSAFGLAILTRPITAVPAAVVGLRQAWRERRWGPAIKVGVLSVLGVAVLALYNRWLFGSAGVAGEQSSPVVERTLQSYNPLDYLGNLFEMYLGVPNGFLLFSPVILVAAVGVIQIWRTIPDWARSGALAGLIYLLVHAAANRASGGMQIFYRYPLEALALALPALAWGAHKLWQAGGLPRRLLLYTSLFSIAMQFVNAFYISCQSAVDYPTLCGIYS